MSSRAERPKGAESRDPPYAEWRGFAHDYMRAVLCLRRQPDNQTVHLTTARTANCASGDSLQARLCLRRQLGAKNRRSLSPDAQSGARAVARCTVWRRSCRRMHSLAGGRRRMRTVFRLLGWGRTPAGQNENGIPFAGMARGVGSSQQTEYRSHSAQPRARAIPASQISFSNPLSMRAAHPSKPNTVLTPAPAPPGLWVAAVCRPSPRGGSLDSAHFVRFAQDDILALAFVRSARMTWGR